jgi:leucyl aminopeptidase (aminopeptidase T)
MNTLRDPAETAVNQCLNLGTGESFAVVTDRKREQIAEMLYEVAGEVTDDVTLVRYPVGEQHGAEPPESVAAAMAGADVVLAPTTKSLSHTTARADATDGGTRAATLPGITEEVFVTGLNADYSHIAAACEDVLGQVAGADEIRVTSPQGTDITLEPGSREWIPDTGIVHEPGDFSNLPAGEVFVSPETANGRVVVDGTMRPHGRLDGNRVAFTVEDGHVTSVEDESVREELEAAKETAGEDVYNLAELGIGTNVAVTNLVGSVLLDEKAGGTVHLAIGDDHAIGGDIAVPIHLDGILTEPTVYADGTEIDLPRA